MSMGDWGGIRTPAMRVAVGALVVAVAVTIWALVRAFQTQPLPDTPALTIASLETISRPGDNRPTDIDAAVESDLFSADRSAPAAPYRMPGENGPAEKAAEPMKPVLLGTAVATDGRHFATVQLGDARPTLVHVGDKIGEWVVRAIERGKITLVSAGGTRTDVTVPKPGI